jgi:truncated hemoglobin YjbI
MRRFYETYVPADPLLQPLFGTMPADHPERVAAWVAEVFGGPEVYSVPYGGFQRMMSRHLGGNFSEPQRARFVELIVRSADDVGLPSDPEFRAAFVAYFEWGSRIATETSRPGAKPPRNMQMPRWNWIRDAVPGSRPPSFARHERRPELVVPQADATVRFAVHIRPQFRKMDRLAMIYAFDLWNVESVRSKAPAILARLRDGTMPVDGAWSPEAIDLFARWIESGMSE